MYAFEGKYAFLKKQKKQAKGVWEALCIPEPSTGPDKLSECVFRLDPLPTSFSGEEEPWIGSSPESHGVGQGDSPREGLGEYRYSHPAYNDIDCDDGSGERGRG